MPAIRLFILHGLIFFCIAAHGDEVRTEDIQFERGASSAIVRGALSGYDTANYRLRAMAGQQMRAMLETDNASNYFNIYAPGKGPGQEAMFIGSIKGKRFSGSLPADGVYTVQVFLMRSAARRDESANYTLHVEIDPKSATPDGDG
ncbi:hypothetical protein [Microbulbifer magnicolonia]|uniref:hypothetical protein n=1 Tax=Microbulbifer magnicolonia TaxID=3109744 RepID=UPI002B4115D9|nr:hypothetical protein [Microbulbifer sp. GG15]